MTALRFDLRDDALRRIDQFLALRGWAESTLGNVVCKNSRVIAKLRRGDNVKLETIERILDYIDAQTTTFPELDRDPPPTEEIEPRWAKQKPVRLTSSQLGKGKRKARRKGKARSLAAAGAAA